MHFLVLLFENDRISSDFESDALAANIMDLDFDFANAYFLAWSRGPLLRSIVRIFTPKGGNFVLHSARWCQHTLRRGRSFVKFINFHSSVIYF